MSDPSMTSIHTCSVPSGVWVNYRITHLVSLSHTPSGDLEFPADLNMQVLEMLDTKCGLNIR